MPTGAALPADPGGGHHGVTGRARRPWLLARWLVGVGLCLLIAACTASGPTPTPSPPPSPPPPAPSPTPTSLPATPTPTPASRPTPLATASPAPTPTSRTASLPLRGRILFQRGGDLWAIWLASGRVEHLVADVQDFALSPDGQWLAILRGQGRSAEVWVGRLADRQLRRITVNDQAEAGLTWSSRNVLAFAAAPADPPGAFGSWHRWCQSARIWLWDEREGLRPLVEGCDPAWSPEGLRLAFASRVVATDAQSFRNTITLVNSRGQNAWQPVTLEKPRPAIFDRLFTGRTLYGPRFLAENSLLYSRDLGYAALCDWSTLERLDLRTGALDLLSLDGSWNRTVVVQGPFLAQDIEVCNAPGFQGYNTRSLRVLDLGQPGTLPALPFPGARSPDQPVAIAARLVWQQRAAHAPALSPGGALLAYIAPPAGWPARPGPGQTPDPASPYNSTAPGDLWVRDLETGVAQRLLTDITFGSRLVWVPE